MKRKGLFTIILVLVFAVTTVPLLVAGGSGAKTSGEVVTIKVTSYQPENHPTMKFYKEVFFDEVEKRSNKSIKIDYLGGPEVIDTFDMGNAILEGIIDMAYVFGPAYGDIVEGTEMLINSGISFEEEKKRGVFEYLQEFHHSAGMHLLGRAQILTSNFFYIGGKKEIDDLQDLDGTRLAAEFLLVKTLPKFGAIPASVPDDEAYSAIEKGVIDGYMTGIIDVVPLGWNEVTDYILDNSFFTSNDVFVMSLKKWEELSTDQQEIVNGVYADMQAAYPAFYEGLVKEAREQLTASGVEFTKFSEQEAKKWIEMIRESEFDEMVKRAPNAGLKLREMLTP